MHMTMSKDLFLSILAMDAYNRGYNTGIDGLSNDPGTGIGNAKILRDSDTRTDSPEVNASFYAVAYDVGAGVGGGGWQPRC
jgi:hypothetical protein